MSCPLETVDCKLSQRQPWGGGMTSEPRRLVMNPKLLRFLIEALVVSHSMGGNLWHYFQSCPLCLYRACPPPRVELRCIPYTPQSVLELDCVVLLLWLLLTCACDRFLSGNVLRRVTRSRVVRLVYTHRQQCVNLKMFVTLWRIKRTKTAPQTRTHWYRKDTQQIGWMDPELPFGNIKSKLGRKRWRSP
eukprot:4775652-Amphidinium_carterae.1